MNPARAIRPLAAPKLAPALVGTLAVVVGGLVLTGWALDIPGLKSILSGWVPMKPNTAVAFILSGIALLPFSHLPSTPNPHRSGFLFAFGRLCGLLAGLIGLLTLGEYAFDWNPGIDQWFSREPAGTVSTSFPGRMAPYTALNFVLLAGALWIVSGPSKSHRALLASLISGLLMTTLALAALLCYFTPSLGAFEWLGLTMMAVDTSALFAVLGLTVIAITWESGVLSWSLSKTTTVVFACGLALLAFIGLSISRSQVKMHETDSKMAHNEKVLGRIAGILAEIANTQTHTRGYIITRDERFLKSFLSTSTRCNREMDALHQLVADSPRQQLQFARLEAQVRVALPWFQKVIDASRTGMTPATRLEMVGHGEDVMDHLRQIFWQIESEERRFLQQAQEESKNVDRHFYLIISTGMFASLGIFLTVLFGLNHSVGERQRAGEALKVSEARYRSLFENMLEGVSYCRMIFAEGRPQDFLYLSVNSAYEKLTGLREVAGRKATEVMPGIRETDPELFEIYGRVVQTGLPEKFEIYVEALQMWFDISVYSPGQEHFVAVFDAITERKRAEEGIRKLNAGLQAANQELETFAYSVSHDLRAPLRSIDGFSRIVLEDYADKLDDEGRDNLNRVCAASQRMAVLIDDLLKLSHVGRTEMRRMPVDLTTLAEEIAAELQRAEPLRKMRWVIAPGLAATGDRQLLRATLENLLGNAWKFTGKRTDAVIEVGAEDGERGRAFFVRDNGAGFDMAYAGKLFGAFQRLHAATDFPGTGIGLATVQRIIHRHGGRVWTKGEVNHGATFYFTLPATPQLT